MERIWRRRYSTRLMQHVGRVTLPIGPTAEERIRLQAVFQPLTLRQDPLAAEDLAREHRRPLLGEEEKRRKTSVEEGDQAEDGPLTVATAHEALRRSRFGRMVVLGGPGTGKTTVLKELVVAACREALRSDSAPLPLFIPLPDLARSGAGVREYLPEQLARLGLPPELASELWDTITSGQALVCLDSLDEVAPNRRPDIIAWISREAPRSGGRWVIGSRFTSYKGGELGTDNFSEWDLAPLDAPLRLELARRLLPILRSSLHAPPVTPEEDAVGLIAAVSKHPQASAAWGENPLLLSLAAVSYVKNAGLPTSRAALYGEVLAAVLRTREPDAKRQRELMRALGRAALTLFLSKGRTFTRAELEDAVAALETPTADLAARAIASGVLDVVARDIFAFRHQTLQEYLAASALAFDLTGSDAQAISAWELMWSKRAYSRWTEVLRLVVGILVRGYGAEGAQQAQRWLAALANQGEGSEGDPGHLGLMLAVRSAAEAADAPAHWTEVEGVQVAALLVRWWASRFLRYRWGDRRYELGSMIRTAKEILALDPQAIAAGMDEALSLLRSSDSHQRRRAQDVLLQVAAFLPTAPLVDHWQALQTMPRDDTWPSEAGYALRIISLTGRRAPVDLLLGAVKSYSPAAYRALVVAANLGNEPALAACRRLAGDSNALVRKAIVSTIPDESTSSELVDLAIAGLRDLDVMVCGASAHTLQRIGRKAGGLPAALDPLVKALEHNDSSVRAAAAFALAYMPAKEAVGALISALRDGNETVRLQSANALGELRAVEAFAPLLEKLHIQSESASVRVVTLASLARIDPAASVPHVVAFFESDDFNTLVTAARNVTSPVKLRPFDTLLAACRILTGLGKLLSIESLTRLSAKPFPAVRETAAKIFMLYGGTAPREPLISLLADDETRVRAAAAAALGATGDRLMIPHLRRLLADSDWSVRTTAMAALGSVGEPGQDLAVEDLLADLRVCDDATISVALSIAGELKEDAPLGILREGLQNPSVKIRRAAIQALGTAGSEEAAFLLLSALGDEDPNLRGDAVRAFGFFQPDVFPISELVSLLHTDTDAGVRAVTALELRRAGDALPTPDLADALADPDERVRAAAAQTLGILGAGAPLEKLVAALEDPFPNVRSAATRALAAFGDRVPREKLLGALERAGPRFFEQLPFVTTLGAASDRIPVEFFLAAERDPHCPWRPAAIAALGYYGAKAPVERLIELLAQDRRQSSLQQANQASAASHALLQLGARVPVERMLAFLSDGDQYRSEYGEKALVALGADAPIPQLRTLLRAENPDIRRRALRVLSELGSRAPDDIFVTALDDPSDTIRELAATEIRRRKLSWALPHLEATARRADNDLFTLRVALQQALIALGGAADSAILIQVLVEGAEEDEIYTGAAEALMAMGDGAPGVELLPYLGGEHAGVAQLTAGVLHATHPELLLGVLPEITAIVRERRAGVIVGARMQKAMAGAIGQMPRVPPDLLAVVADLLDWPFAPVRWAAAQSIGHIRRNIPDATIRKLLSLRSGPDYAAADSALELILSLETGIEDD